MLTLGALQQKVAQNLQITSSQFYREVQITNFINHTYQRIWDEAVWPSTQLPVDLTILAGADLLTLPKQYDFIIRPYNRTTGYGGSLLDGASYGDQNLTVKIGLVRLGSFQLTPKGVGSVEAQPASPSLIYIRSSSAADSGIEVAIKGTDANGEIQTEAIISNGTTNVASALTYTTVENVAKMQTPTAGNFIVTDGAAATIARISSWEQSPKYRSYIVSDVATTDTDVTALVKKSFVPFLSTFDVAAFDCDNALENGATARGWAEHRQSEKAGYYENLFQNDMAVLMGREKSQHVPDLMLPMGRF
jgi:hypothetical protein